MSTTRTLNLKSVPRFEPNQIAGTADGWAVMADAAGTLWHVNIVQGYAEPLKFRVDIEVGHGRSR